MITEGFPDAIQTVYPQTHQLCIVHRVRNSVKYVPWKDYQQISKSWRRHWENLNTLFAYPSDIRKAIYTTHAIESLKET